MPYLDDEQGKFLMTNFIYTVGTQLTVTGIGKTQYFKDQIPFTTVNHKIRLGKTELTGGHIPPDEMPSLGDYVITGVCDIRELKMLKVVLEPITSYER